VLVAASDYLKALPTPDRSVDAAAARLARHRRLRPQRGRAELREFFEVDARFVALARWRRWRARARSTLKVVQAIRSSEIDPEKRESVDRLRLSRRSG
jgi:pyruvate dehydrogenase complex dehydrogenase (E1) component